MGNLDTAVDKLIRMHQYIQELKELKPETYEEYLADTVRRYAVERVLQLVVDLALDLNNILLAHCNRPPASDYYNSFLDLAECDVLEPQFALSIAPSTGLRNRLVHEYEKINDQMVYDSIDLTISMYNQYMAEINGFINR